MSELAEGALRSSGRGICCEKGGTRGQLTARAALCGAKGKAVVASSSRIAGCGALDRCCWDRTAGQTLSRREGRREARGGAAGGTLSERAPGSLWSCTEQLKLHLTGSDKPPCPSSRCANPTSRLLNPTQRSSSLRPLRHLEQAIDDSLEFERELSKSSFV